jgi:predicted  nucleic acid-binding Zn-ribbon protein
MPEQEYTYDDYFSEVNAKLRDLEEKQNLTRDRVLLIGKNLVNIREKEKSEVAEIKRQIDFLKKEIEKIKETLQTVLDEFEDFARKDDLTALENQIDMFSSLNEK